jgi:RimJ/RimL family protein N-acetyltransferase
MTRPAIETIVKLAFDQIGLSELICCTLTTNIASRRVMEKVGFRFEKEATKVGIPHRFSRLTAAEFSARG